VPNYLLHQTADGTPIGVFTAEHDYYDSEYEQLRPEGREVVFSKLPSVSWNDFIERLASTTPSRTMRWDVYYDSSPNLGIVLSHAQRDTEKLGYPEPE
jgi:hypothetical protein